LGKGFVRKHPVFHHKEEDELFEILVTVLCIWLFIKGIGLALKIAWGMAKITATILMALALPALVLCLLFAGGVLLLVPVALVAIAVGILKACF
jgi:hypothetical protein